MLLQYISYPRQDMSVHIRKGMGLKRDTKLSAMYVIRNFLYIFNRDAETGENEAGGKYTSHIR